MDMDMDLAPDPFQPPAARRLSRADGVIRVRTGVGGVAAAAAR